MSPIPNATFELDAQNRESLVLDVGLPVLGAWARSVRVYGFRPSMGVSGLSPREVARLRTLGLATSAKATGLFEGANDFRMGFPIGAEGLPTQPSSVEADLGGHSLAPVVADLTAAAFGMPAGRTLTHRLHGFTISARPRVKGMAGGLCRLWVLSSASASRSPPRNSGSSPRALVGC